jgi:hypothetical protein
MQAKTKDQERLQSHVDSIANDLCEGMTYAECGMDHEESGAEPEDTITGFDWLHDVLDINYVLNSDRSFKSAKVLVAFGGPNIWVCFDDMKVKGYWWGDYAEASFSGNFANEIESALEELYSC